MADEHSGTPPKETPTEAPSKKGLAAVLDEVRETTEVLKGKAKDDIESLKQPQKTALFKSIFRVKHDESSRSRALGVLSNVFLHLHPAKINRDAVRYSYTWGWGHHLLPFHRTHSHRRAADVLLPSDQGAGVPRHYLFDERCALRLAAAQHAPLGGAPDGHHGVAAHVPRLSDGFVQEAARV